MRDGYHSAREFVNSIRKSLTPQQHYSSDVAGPITGNHKPRTKLARTSQVP
jgi:hypothetical protein